MRNPTFPQAALLPHRTQGQRESRRVWLSYNVCHLQIWSVQTFEGISASLHKQTLEKGKEVAFVLGVISPGCNWSFYPWLV